MVRKYLCILTVGVMVLGLSHCTYGQDKMFPFVMPWDDSTKSIVYVGHLNAAPIGAEGAISVRNGHFYDQNSKRVRFLGVNMTAGACFPTKPDAEKVATRLRKYGINIVRFHHMDADWAKPNLYEPNSKNTQTLSKESLDRLDYFIHQLKINGIYTNLNLKVSRKFTSEDGLPDPSELGYASKPADYFHPKMIELQKEFAKEFLSRKNPYTQTTYIEEPAIAVIELNNENSLVGAPWEGIGGLIASMPPVYREELRQQWNTWLEKKYKTNVALVRKWRSADKPFGPNRLRNADFTAGAEHWNVEMNTPPGEAKMSLPTNIAKPAGVQSQPIRLTVETLGGQNWHIQFNQARLDLTDGEPYTISFWAKADRERSLPVNASLDTDDYRNIGLQSVAKLTTQWQKFQFSFVASRTKKDHNRITFFLGDALGAIEMADIALRPGVESVLPQGAALEKKNYPLGKPGADPAGRDWVEFLVDVERRYNAELRDYLKKTLKCKANITNTQSAWGGVSGLLRERENDFVDMHAYWQHPEFPGTAWDPKNWRINNISMVADRGFGTFPELARYRLAGKPYTVSEYNHPAPNDFLAETVPMLVAYAAVQDWDGIYLFDYGNDRGEGKISGFFAIDANPAIMAFLPAASLLFLRNDMALAHSELRLRVNPAEVPEIMSKSGLSISSLWSASGIQNNDAIQSRLSVGFQEGAKQPEPKPVGDRASNDNANKPRSAIRWNPQAEYPTFIAESPSSKVMVGILGGQTVETEGLTVKIAEGGKNFAALTLTAIDGKTMERSFSMLLTAMSHVENKGMVWNKDRTSVGDQWGTGPTVVQGVEGQVTIRTVVTLATVYALDATGKRTEKVPSEIRGGELTFRIEPKYKAVWYEIEAGLKR